MKTIGPTSPGVQPDPIIAALVSSAADATEHFTDNELEQYAETLANKRKDKCMTLKIEINLDNAAFYDNGKDYNHNPNPEVARILTRLAQSIEKAWPMELEHSFRVADSNGNKVGKAEVVE